MLEHLPRMFPSAATFSSTDVIKILFALMFRFTGRKKKEYPYRRFVTVPFTIHWKLKGYKDTYMLITNKAKQLLTTVHIQTFANEIKMLFCLYQPALASECLFFNRTSRDSKTVFSFFFLENQFWLFCEIVENKSETLKTRQNPFLKRGLKFRDILPKPISKVAPVKRSIRFFSRGATLVKCEIRQLAIVGNIAIATFCLRREWKSCEEIADFKWKNTRVWRDERKISNTKTVETWFDCRVWVVLTKL